MFSACSEFKLKCVDWSCETLKFDISNFVFMTIILFNIEERRACQGQRFCNCNGFESDGLYKQTKTTVGVILPRDCFSFGDDPSDRGSIIVWGPKSVCFQCIRELPFLPMLVTSNILKYFFNQ